MRCCQTFSFGSNLRHYNKAACPEKWTNQTIALQSLPLFPGEKNPPKWRNAVMQLCEHFGLTVRSSQLSDCLCVSDSSNSGYMECRRVMLK